MIRNTKKKQIINSIYNEDEINITDYDNDGDEEDDNPNNDKK